MKSCLLFLSGIFILLICTHEGRGNVVKPLPWFSVGASGSWHVLITDTIPVKKPEPEKDDKKEMQQGKPGVPENSEATNEPVKDAMRTVKTVPKSKKQPKPVVVTVPNTLPVKVPKLKTPKVVIRKLKL